MKYLIIGASSGLGRELTKKFAEKGHNLIIASRDERDLNAIKSDLLVKFITISLSVIIKFLKLNIRIFKKGYRWL